MSKFQYRVNILVYTPPSERNYVRIGRCGGSTKSGTEFPPIKLMYLAGVARERANVLFIDADAEGISDKEFLARAKKFKPDIIVAEPTPASLKDEIFIAKKIKEIFKNTKVILTGPFVSAVADEILKKYKEVDCIIQGEAEKTLERIIKGEAEAKGIHKQDFFMDLDKLPLPVHDLIPTKKYISAFIRKFPYTTIETSRGCPFSCTYCNAFLSSGKKPRFRSVKNIIKELKFVKSLGIKGFYLNDETFTLDKERLKKLMKAMIKEKFNFGWACNARTDTVDKEILDLMKKAGCTCIFYGVESGNQKIIDYYKKNIKLEDALKAFKLTKKAGIETMAHFILGAPEESLDTINDTVKFAKTLNPDLASFNILTAYPGTELFDDLKKKGFIEITDWSLVDQSIKANLRTQFLTARELELAAKNAYRKFYYRPKYILRKLFKIRSFRDLAKLIKGFFTFLNLIKK